MCLCQQCLHTMRHNLTCLLQTLFYCCELCIQESANSMYSTSQSIQLFALFKLLPRTYRAGFKLVQRFYHTKLALLLLDDQPGAHPKTRVVLKVKTIAWFGIWTWVTTLCTNMLSSRPPSRPIRVKLLGSGVELGSSFTCNQLNPLIGIWTWVPALLDLLTSLPLSWKIRVESLF